MPPFSLTSSVGKLAVSLVYVTFTRKHDMQAHSYFGGVISQEPCVPGNLTVSHELALPVLHLVIISRTE